MPARPCRRPCLICCRCVSRRSKRRAVSGDGPAELGARVSTGGRISNAALEADQFAAHALAWTATYVESLKQLQAGPSGCGRAGAFGEMEALILQIGFGEYLGQLARRHPDVAGRDRPAQGPGLVGRTGGAAGPEVAGADRRGQQRCGPGAAGRADAERAGRGHLRRHRARRRVRDDPRPVPPLRRGPGGAPRPRLAPEGRADPDGDHRRDGRARRVRADHPRGIRRLGHVEDRDVRGLRGAEPGLYRGGLARHPLGDRGRADPRRRDRGAEAALAAEDRQRRDPADRGLHRAQHRLGPRQPAHPGGARGRRLCRDRQQDLDHPCGAGRRDDPAGAHRSRHLGLFRPVDAAGREAAGHRGRRRSRRRA